ncbi:HAMP domain-containing histidine kinase [Sulfidibacter corallicola]|uniref:histidine kinase n=1 Tax=Sulfidibacter corallicola TaxID=2818388 RepID=A0A8A4TLX0_SULCO|nr:HAMP domain-containing sensor histidine kinase [Sulfidibacter corallicola]QTD50560.1 HAMP domain-containing histidine kinase [Sulfidibacter corallicola]
MKKLSLGLVVILTLLVTAMSMVIGYTFMIRWYFEKGFERNTADQFELEAILYERALREDPDARLPFMRTYQVYVGEETLPDAILARFPVEKHRAAHLLTDAEHDFTVFDDIGKEFAFHCLYPYDLFDGRRLYFYLKYTHKELTPAAEQQFLRIWNLVWRAALVFLLFVAAIAYLLVRQLRRPIGDMAAWAEGLTMENLARPRPSFTYKELELVAAKLHGAFQRITEVLQREQHFLRFASHELRTPIAVIRNNVELIHRRIEGNHPLESPMARIDRSAKTMAQMTETLLWLSREEDTTPQAEPVALDRLVASLIEEYRYLLEGKSVVVETNLEPLCVETAESPCRIAVSNLLRNAFQYTSEGTVSVVVDASGVFIRNRNVHDEVIDHGGACYGFGMGLTLVEKISNKMGWQYENREIDGGREVTLRGW